MGATCTSCRSSCAGDSQSRKNINDTEEKKSRGDTPDDTDDESEIQTEPEVLIKQWESAVDSNNNIKIKQLFGKHYKHLNFLQIKWPNGDNTLHRACATNNVKLVKFLLILKLNINEKNEQNGNTGLHYAALNGHEKIVTLLIKVGTIDLTICNNDGYTPLDISRLPKTSNLTIEKLLSEAVESNEHKLDASQKTLRGGYDSDGLDHRGDDNNNNNNSSNYNINNIGGINISYSGDEGGSGPNSPIPGVSGSGISGLSPASASISTSTSVDSGSDKESVGINSARKKDRHKSNKRNYSKIDKSGWIEKKRDKFPHRFEKEYVVICQGYLLWNHKKIDITNKKLSLNYI